MITHFLGDQEVAAYCRDLIKRLTNEKTTFPLVWAELGISGRKLGDVLRAELADIKPELLSQISYIAAQYDRTSDSIDYSGGLEASDLPDTPVLLLDSAVHSGRSMLRLYRSLEELGVKRILSYALVLKSGSIIVPTYFGMVIDDKDRAYFQLKDMPNNRLGHPPPPGILREVVEADVGREIESVGAPFVGMTIGDMVYDIATKNSRVYVYEQDDKIVGFINFRLNHRSLFIDAWATAESARGQKIGSATMRWAETWARAKKCERIELWAYEDAISTYLAYGYKFSDERERSLGDKKHYRVMHKAILYNVRPTSEDELKTFY